jgi:hypothetical protein
MARLPSKRKGQCDSLRIGTRAGSVVPTYYSDLGNLQVAQGVGLAHDGGHPQEAVLPKQAGAATCVFDVKGPQGVLRAELGPASGLDGVGKADFVFHALSVARPQRFRKGSCDTFPTGTGPGPVVHLYHSVPA